MDLVRSFFDYPAQTVPPVTPPTTTPSGPPGAVIPVGTYVRLPEGDPKAPIYDYVPPDLGATTTVPTTTTACTADPNSAAKLCVIS